ncbi:hypothetical protein jhhlp_007382 [Lomentospora prolificans]|uniref:PWWP domain-containing protein n=1 Tax=Lomentospora prolificans TaxID=41688 RepID=A0A2N3N2J1_9PEZI|nr:hypothetical protein jhhlp_007382 [Lomentospora prolificans]
MSSSEPSTDKKEVAPTAPAAAADDSKAVAESKAEVIKEAQSGTPANASTDATSSEKPSEETDSKPDAEKSAGDAEKMDKQGDTEMNDATTEDAAPPTDSKNTVADDKTKAARRKSTGAAEKGGKKLNKKQSKARITNLNAQPGDLYLVKLKGFPPWPAVICDEAMLPQRLLTTRPVTAKRADGTYREDFADGGKRVNDRTFPVMYLYTNEFGWVPNTSLQELSPEQASEAINDKMRKDLQSAYELASEGHDLDYYKDVLQQFQEELVAKEEAKKTKKSKAAAADSMDIDDVEDATPAKKTKKRKAEDETATPQRTDSVKKPKIKLLNSAAKASNGATTPKTSKEQATSKVSKAKTKSKAPEEPKKPELSPKERHERRVKEVLYLRHKLQKGFFPRDSEIKEEEMQAMSEFFTRLEKFTEMEASILKATRIHKVPKAILRMEAIPKDEEFNFKSRSQGLLDQWNKLLAADAGSNGVNGADEKKDSKLDSNGGGEASEKAADTEKPEPDAEEAKNEAADEKADDASAEESQQSKVLTAVEASA